ncbi:IS1 family transposase [Corallococcus sp. AB045]|nr:IS1 family transposase [Corallococcus sp. AB045]
MACHHCGSPAFRKNGHSAGVQRYLCRACGRSFSANGERFSKALKAQALDMYLNNVGIRKIARFTGASPPAVLKWIRKAAQALAAQLEQASAQVQEDLPDVIEMDEIYTFVQKNSAAPSYGLLILAGKVALLRTSSATLA